MILNSDRNKVAFYLKTLSIFVTLESWIASDWFSKNACLTRETSEFGYVTVQR